MHNLTNSKRAGLLASLATQNSTLKAALVAAAAILVAETISLCALTFRHPIVVGIENNGPRVLESTEDSEAIGQPELKAFLFDVLSKRFSRTPNAEVEQRTCNYFSEGLKQACQNEIKAKKVFLPQDFVLEELGWDERSSRARLSVKRYVTFNGTVSTVESHLQLKLSKRTRAEANPWGIFIDDWKEEVKK